MRGKEFILRPRANKTRITPAYAGKRAGSSGNYSTAGDHPRVCGEKSSVFVFCDLPIGSPPHMRGKVIGCIQMVVGAGITPAYAGKSAQHVGCPPSPWGSPPRMRGKGISLHRIAHHWGITPAYAGKRLKRSHSIGHFSCILCLFHSVLHRASVSGGSRAGPCAPPCLPAQNAVPV